MEKLKLGEKLGFATGVFGQNIIYGLVSSYLLLYYTDVALLPLTVIGTLFVVARIWDAVNDPFMGIIADKTRTRWGRFRPYLLFVPIPMAILSVLIFSIPDISMTGKIIFAYVSYILWGMLYTVGDIPMWSMTSVITKDTNQKTSLISLISIFSFIGIIGVSIVFVPMVNAFGGTSSQAAFQKAVIILAVIAAATMMLIFFSTKERVQPTQRTVTIKESFRALFTNKPLMLVIISFIISNSFMTIMQAMVVFFAQYNLGDSNLVSILTICMFIPLLIGAGLTGVIAKAFGKKNTLIYSTLLRALVLFVFYFVGYDNMIAIYIFYAINGLLIGIPIVLLTSMISDCVVYSEWKTGIRSDGLSFSMRTFMAKLASAIGGGLSAFILALYGYVANNPVSEFTQTGIFNTMSIFPAAAAVVGIIPIFFYSLTQDKVVEMTKEIEERKAQAE